MKVVEMKERKASEKVDWTKEIQSLVKRKKDIYLKWLNKKRQVQIKEFKPSRGISES